MCTYSSQWKINIYINFLLRENDGVYASLIHTLHLFFASALAIIPCTGCACVILLAMATGQHFWPWIWFSPKWWFTNCRPVNYSGIYVEDIDHGHGSFCLQFERLSGIRTNPTKSGCARAIQDASVYDGDTRYASEICVYMGDTWIARDPWSRHWSETRTESEYYGYAPVFDWGCQHQCQTSPSVLRRDCVQADTVRSFDDPMHSSQICRNDNSYPATDDFFFFGWLITVIGIFPLIALHASRL